MGRKIPGKKHRSIKDPNKQRQKRFESIRLKINNPPSNCDEQEIPKSLLRIMALKNKTKQEASKKPKKRKKKKQILLSVAKSLDKDPIQPGMTKPDKYIPNLIQKPDESAEHFLKRVSYMTHNLINEVEFEKKFGVEITRNLETGEVIGVKNVNKKKSRSKKKKLSEKRKEKMLIKKQNAANFKDFNQLKDIVEFGEVVHRPPILSKIKITKPEENVQKPRYGNLLLSHVVGNNLTESENKLSALQKEKAECERKFIVEAYRKAKKKNL